MRTFQLLLGGCLSAIVIAGCGSSNTPTASVQGNVLAKEPPAEILKQSADALAKVKSFRMDVSIASVSNSRNRMRFSGDLYSAHAFALSFNVNGLAASILLDDGTAYMRASYQFWTHFTNNPTVGGMLSPHWFKAPPDSVGQFTDAAHDFTASTLARCLDLRSPGIGVVGRMTVRGQPAVVLGDVRHKADHSILAIAASGKPYPLLIRGVANQADGGSSGSSCGSSALPSSAGGLPWSGANTVDMTLSDFNNVGRMRLPAHPIMDLRGYVRSLVSE
jgi:hypothetical protein